jgi:uncharacterized protein (DUF58 family)
MPAQQQHGYKSSGIKYIDPAAVLAIQDFELRARVIVEGFLTGLHRSPYHGFSVEFTEYRQYTPGDDPRYLDWRLVGRTDRYFIKKFEDETNLRCVLLLDQSRSMAYGTPFSKAEYANTLAATLAYFLHQQRDATGVLTFAEGTREYLPPRYRPGHLRQLMLLLDKPPSGKETNLTKPLERVAELLRKRGMLVVISDFLFPVEELEKEFRRLAGFGHELSLFQVLHPTELDLNLGPAVMLEDVESERRLYIDPALARKEYQSKFEAHREGLRNACKKLGVSLHLARTDQPLEKCLLDFLADRGALS